MHQADSNTTTSRRALLKGLGAVPVAGALAAGTATAGTALARQVLTDSDPIFDVIEAHKKAAKASAATWRMIEKIEDEAHEAGMSAGVLCPDHREGADGSTLERAECVSEINELVPDDTRLQSVYANKLQQSNARRMAWVKGRLGGRHPDDIISETVDVERAAAIRYAELVPTTRAGLRAKLEYLSQVLDDPNHDWLMRDDTEITPQLLASLSKSAALLKEAVYVAPHAFISTTAGAV